MRAVVEGMLRQQYMKWLDEPIFSEFAVTNPATGRTCRVAIRGEGLGENFCSCPDFAVNTLGTCKHIESTLDKLRRRRGGAAAMREGFHPPYSEVFVRYGLKREVVFRPGTECPAALRRAAATYFDADGLLRAGAYERFDAFLKRSTRTQTDRVPRRPARVVFALARHGGER